MANWKMNGDLHMVKNYIKHLNESNFNPKIELVIFPPAIYLPEFEALAESSKYHWGAQNIYAEHKGAFTGEISVSMLKDFGATYVLVGHSERRHLFKEDEKVIAKKFHIVKEYGMIPVVCIGETLEQYQNQQTRDVLRQQLKSLKIDDAFSFEKSIIAYEPVWAIGTGLLPTPEEIQKVFVDIRNILKEIDVKNQNTPLLYGGSVGVDNFQAIDGIKEGQGVLIGGASLKIEQLLEITQCIVCC